MSVTELPTALTTRERILEIARELFIDQGFDGTSLREIAERLGFTKAALYYHFQSKDELLAALLEPGLALISELIDRLEEANGVEEWAQALEWVLTQISGQLDFFRLVERNRAAIEASQLSSFESIAEHQQMHERIEAAVLSNTPDLTTRVKMFSALGAVTAFDDWAPTLLFDTPAEDLQRELSAVIRNILGVPLRKPPRAARRT